jgi:hypothetical protein
LDDDLNVELIAVERFELCDDAGRQEDQVVNEEKKEFVCYGRFLRSVYDFDIAGDFQLLSEGKVLVQNVFELFFILSSGDIDGSHFLVISQISSAAF